MWIICHFDTITNKTLILRIVTMNASLPVKFRALIQQPLLLIAYSICITKNLQLNLQYRILWCSIK